MKEAVGLYRGTGSADHAIYSQLALLNMHSIYLINDRLLAGEVKEEKKKHNRERRVGSINLEAANASSAQHHL